MRIGLQPIALPTELKNLKRVEASAPPTPDSMFELVYCLSAACLQDAATFLSCI